MQPKAWMPKPHPAGEPIPKQLGDSWPVDTPSGRYHAEFDDESPVTREGQLIFFAQFLRVGGRWARFVSNCPLSYEGNRGSRVVDVLGTATLSGTVYGGLLLVSFVGPPLISFPGPVGVSAEWDRGWR
jgi:hypothetical protein